jgi:hypothetical protein
VAPGVDADQDPLSYEFEIYADEALTDLVANGRTSAPQWQLPSDLADKTRYYWRARAVDPHDAAGDWMAPVPVFVKAVDVEPPAHIRLRVLTAAGEPIAGIYVYAFTESGIYTGNRALTDDTGTALFESADFDDGSYVFRVDYRGHHFWSDPLGLPGTYALEVTIALQPVALTVTAAAGPVAGAKVYLFSPGGVYLGTYALTDADGRVTFDLPVGKAFKFRTDILGNRYWSDEVVVAVGGSSTVVETGGGRLQVTLQKADDEPMAGIRLYLFSDTGSYLGRVETTDEQGRAAFDLSRGTYRLRADYLGYRFWSQDTPVVTDTAVAMTIGHHDTELTVSGVFLEEPVPLQDVGVYLFNPAGSYLGSSAATDENGKVLFSLPEKAFQVRADVLGGRFWSPEFTAGPTGQSVALEIPMAAAQVSVTGAGLPREGVPVYLFSEVGSYLGRSESTDADGRVAFQVPEGKYNFRADYQGSRFWSGPQYLARDQVTPVNISAGGGAFTLKVQTGGQQPLPGVRVHVFNSSGAYIGLTGAADENGEAGFDLSDGTYRLRVDYLGQQFWSDPVTVPEDLSTGVTIAQAPVALTVTTAAGPADGVQVYLFSPDGAYLGRCGRTDAAGQAVFDLPVGRSFKFRADIPGGRYWSDVTQVAENGNSLPLDAGGGHLQIGIEKSPGIPLENIRVSLFSEAGNYLGRTETTDVSGAAGFDVPQASYRLRADYLGYRFWTELYHVEADVSGTLTISHRDVTVTVQGTYPSADPLAGVKAYLFNSSGSYVGLSGVTDGDGRVTFSLPDQAFRLRADYLGGQYWSEDFQFRDTTIAIDQGRVDLHVHRSGTNVAGARVYVFSDSGRYLGRCDDTDAGGTLSLVLPAGEFKFRVDEGGGQFWSDTVSLLPDVATPVEMDLDTL